MFNDKAYILQSVAQSIDGLVQVDQSNESSETVTVDVVAAVCDEPDHVQLQATASLVSEEAEQLEGKPAQSVAIANQDDSSKQVETMSLENHAPVMDDGDVTKSICDDNNIERKDHIEDVIPMENAAISLRDEEYEKLGKEVFFRRSDDPKYYGWDNLRWMSHSGTRKIEFVGAVYRFVPGRRNLFWSGDQYLERVLAVYNEPHLLLILRPPENMSEVLEILDLPEGATADNADDVVQSHLLVESVVDPKTCKLKLSALTTVTSVLPDVAVDDFRRRSCFELLCPTETIILSAVRLRKGAERALTSFTDSGAYLETTSMEHVLQKSICNAHHPVSELEGTQDLSWKHQIILGTLHSHVVLGNQLNLEKALAAAKAFSKAEGLDYLQPRVIDVVDESGRTPLHYACSGRSSSAVAALVQSGANVDLRVEPYNMTPCHLCALNLDSKSLQSILLVNRRPNVVDNWGRSPMYLAIMDGRSVGQSKNPVALESCLSVLEAHGGQLETPFGFRHPISALASTWSHEELAVVLKYVSYRYPLVLPSAEDKQRVGISLSALYQYPVHSCLITLRKQISATARGVEDVAINSLEDTRLSV